MWNKKLKNLEGKMILLSTSKDDESVEVNTPALLQSESYVDWYYLHLKTSLLSVGRVLRIESKKGGMHIQNRLRILGT